MPVLGHDLDCLNGLYVWVPFPVNCFVRHLTRVDDDMGYNPMKQHNKA